MNPFQNRPRSGSVCFSLQVNMQLLYFCHRSLWRRKSASGSFIFCPFLVGSPFLSPWVFCLPLFKKQTNWNWPKSCWENQTCFAFCLLAWLSLSCKHRVECTLVTQLVSCFAQESVWSFWAGGGREERKVFPSVGNVGTPSKTYENSPVSLQIAY